MSTDKLQLEFQNQSFVAGSHINHQIFTWAIFITVRKPLAAAGYTMPGSWNRLRIPGVTSHRDCRHRRRPCRPPYHRCPDVVESFWRGKGYAPSAPQYLGHQDVKSVRLVG